MAWTNDDITLAQYLAGIFESAVTDKLSDIKTPIQLLSEGNIEMAEKDGTYTRRARKHQGEAKQVDKYGELSASDWAAAHNYYEDEEYFYEVLNMPEPYVKGFVLARQNFAKFDLTADILKSKVTDLNREAVKALGVKLLKEYDYVVQDHLRRREDRVLKFFRLLGRVDPNDTNEFATPADAKWYMPFGYQVCDLAANRTEMFNYTNLLNDELDATSHTAMTNLFYSHQKTVNNFRFGASELLMLLHADDYSKAATFVRPDLVVNTQQRTAGGMLQAVTKSIKTVDVYHDSENYKSWVAMGKGHTYKTIVRYSPGKMNDDGIYAVVSEKDLSHALILDVYDNSQDVIDTPNDIAKSEVPIV